MQAHGEALEPVVDLIGAANGRQRVLGRGYAQLGVGRELVVAAAVDRVPGVGARLWAQRDLELDRGRHGDGPKRERMRTYGRNDDGRYARVIHGRAGRHRVRGRAGRRGDDEAVALHRRDQVVVHVQVEVGQKRTRSAAHHHLVEREQLEVLAADQRGWCVVDAMVVADAAAVGVGRLEHARVAHRLVHGAGGGGGHVQRRGGGRRLNGPLLEATLEPAAKEQRHAALQHAVHVVLEVVEVERAEEAQRAHVYGKNRWTLFL